MTAPHHPHRLETDSVYKHFIERTRLGLWHKIFLYSATALLWLSGGVWLLRNQPLWMKIHGAAAMAFMMVLGSLVSVHVRRGWVLGRNRFSGVFLTTVCGVLVVSGWVLYYLGSERVRNAVSLIHWIIGLALPLVIYLHILAWQREQAAAEADTFR